MEAPLSLKEALGSCPHSWLAPLCVGGGTRALPPSFPAWMFPGLLWKSSPSCAGRGGPALPHKNALQGPSRAGPEQQSSGQSSRQSSRQSSGQSSGQSWCSLAGHYQGTALSIRGVPQHPSAGPIPPGSRDVQGNGMEMRSCWRHESQNVIFLPLLSSLRVVYSRTKQTEGRELPTVPRVAILFLMGHVKPICSSELYFLTIFLRPRQR